MAARRRLVGVGGLKLKIGEETGHEGHGSRCRVRQSVRACMQKGAMRSRGGMG